MKWRNEDIMKQYKEPYETHLAIAMKHIQAAFNIACEVYEDTDNMEWEGDKFVVKIYDKSTYKQ